MTRHNYTGTGFGTLDSMESEAAREAKEASSRVDFEWFMKKVMMVLVLMYLGEILYGLFRLAFL